MKKDTLTTFVVTKSENKLDLLSFLARKLKLSRRAAKATLDRKKVWVNRRCVWMAHHSLQAGDTVEVAMDQTGAAAQIAPAARTLYTDNDFIVVDKPAGILSTGGANSLETFVRQREGGGALKAVHRLDRDTSGCLLFARHEEAFAAAVTVFKSRRVVKIYQAIVSGRFAHIATTRTDELDGKRARSHIQREALSRDASFIRIRIETGRTHQIRRHLSAMRHPVLGDRQYGHKRTHDERQLSVPRQMLHAATLELPHPLHKELKIKAHSPLPADFRRCLRLFDMGK